MVIGEMRLLTNAYISCEANSSEWLWIHESLAPSATCRTLDVKPSWHPSSHLSEGGLRNPSSNQTLLFFYVIACVGHEWIESDDIMILLTSQGQYREDKLDNAYFQPFKHGCETFVWYSCFCTCVPGLIWLTVWDQEQFVWVKNSPFSSDYKVV